MGLTDCHKYWAPNQVNKAFLLPHNVAKVSEASAVLYDYVVCCTSVQLVRLNFSAYRLSDSTCCARWASCNICMKQSPPHATCQVSQSVSVCRKQHHVPAGAKKGCKTQCLGCIATQPGWQYISTRQVFRRDLSAAKGWLVCRCVSCFSEYVGSVLPMSPLDNDKRFLSCANVSAKISKGIHHMYPCLLS